MTPHDFSIDYSSDFTRWNKVYVSIKDFKTKDGYSAELENIQNNIIETQDAALAYFFATDIGYKNYRMQNVILKSSKGKYIFLFAQNIKNADIAALQQACIDSNQINYIVKFGCFIKGSDIKKIESFVLNAKKPQAKYAHMLIKHIPGIKVSKFKDIIIKSRKPRYLFELAKHLKSKRDIALLEDIVISCKSKTYIKMFAEKIKGSNLEKLEQAVLDLDDPERIKKFAKYVKGSKMRNFSILF